MSNSEELTVDMTKKAYGVVTKDLMAALKILTGLKGIGPATASLLLSVHRLEEVPFFSDVGIDSFLPNGYILILSVVRGFQC
jgi:hypothetical protein